jgi:hypothetical protein
VPLTELLFRCSQCGTDRTDFVVTSRDYPQPGDRLILSPGTPIIGRSTPHPERPAPQPPPPSARERYGAAAVPGRPRRFPEPTNWPAPVSSLQ